MMKAVRRTGIGEASEFYTYHPLVALIYFFMVVGITMFSMAPYLLLITAVTSWTYMILLRGTTGLKKIAVMAITVTVIMTAVNTFFTHNGETVLFYINSNRITAEAIAYGVASSVMLVSVMIWFMSFNVIMSTDKLIFLFGKLAPVIGLVVSMIFRFVPLLHRRFEEISMGQGCMGHCAEKGPIKKIRLLAKEFSILTAWSLEASIESADSMAARGYGLRGRTAFHLFKITARDIAILIYIALTGGIVIAASAMGYTDMYFYPKIVVPTMDLPRYIALVAFILLTTTPMIIDIIGEHRWKKSYSID